jgi:hypothetical protein
MSRVLLGRLVGARSGDKGGAANVGIFVPQGVPDPDAAYAWLEDWLTVDRVHELLPDSSDLRVEIYPLANLRAVNVIIHGLLGRGVSENASLDPQAKGLGEQVRARLVDIPDHLLPPEGANLA